MSPQGSNCRQDNKKRMLGQDNRIYRIENKKLFKTQAGSPEPKIKRACSSALSSPRSVLTHPATFGVCFEQGERKVIEVTLMKPRLNAFPRSGLPASGVVPDRMAGRTGEKRFLDRITG